MIIQNLAMLAMLVVAVILVLGTLGFFEPQPEPEPLSHSHFTPRNIEMPPEEGWYQGKLCAINAMETLCPYNCFTCRSEGNVMKYAFLTIQRIADSTEGDKGVERRYKMDELRGKIE